MLLALLPLLMPDPYAERLAKARALQVFHAAVVYELPLTPLPRSLSTVLPSGKTINLRLIYLFTPNDCWEMDIADDKNVPLVCGIPLVTGADLLAQYGYLGLGVQMYCSTDGDHDAPPRFFNLGLSSHLYIAS